MSIADALGAPPVQVPKQYQQHAEYDTETGKGAGATGPVRAKITDEKQLLELAGFELARPGRHAPLVERLAGGAEQGDQHRRHRHLAAGNACDLALDGEHVDALLQRFERLHIAELEPDRVDRKPDRRTHAGSRGGARGWIAVGRCA